MQMNWLGPLLLAGALSASAAPIVTNGSFEDPTATNVGSFLRLFSPSTAMSGWTVSAGNVDWVGTLWQTSDGLRTVDMSGAGAGTIHQDVTGFTAGQGYELQFDVAGNTFSTSLKQMQVSVLNGSTLVADSLVTFNNTGKTLANMGFELRTLAFTSPVSGALRLRFVGINNDGAGVVLDNVRVAETGGAVPEPGSLALLGAGGVAALLIRRKKTS